MSNDLQKTEVQFNPPKHYFPSDNDWKMMLSLGSAAVKSGMIPESIKTPEQAAIILLKGRELGISPMVAFAHINIIKGKPTMSAELMQSLARSGIPGLKIDIVENTEKICKVEITRPGDKTVHFSFSMEDAAKAGLTGNATWSKYPKAMLLSRCISSAMRATCPDALMGISYTPEEMDPTRNHKGEVEIVANVVSETDVVNLRQNALNNLMTLAKEMGVSKEDLALYRTEILKKHSHELTIQDIENMMQAIHSEELVPKSKISFDQWTPSMTRTESVLNPLR